MARTKTKTEDVKIEEAVAPLDIKDTESETVNIEDAKAEPIKLQTIIAKTPVPFRSKPNLEHRYVTGQMSIGIAYEIVKEVNSKVYGSFYLLNNGSYITKNGNYSIS